VLWTCIIALVAILPWYQYGLGPVSVSGFYMHNAVGMWFTPLALGMFYYALPKLLNHPIYSYSLGVFAFWTNLVFIRSLERIIFYSARCRGFCRPPPSCSVWRCWYRSGVAALISC
jgi:Cytochrome C and Quinol oxidase polypeptide I